MKNYLDSYEVNRNTMAVVPDNKNVRIYEMDDEFVVGKSSTMIMEESCEYFGSTLEGRQKATTKMTGITHKVPIIVEESSRIIFFPTSSPRTNECAWLSLKHVDRYYKVGQKVCIEFKNGKKILLPISYNMIDSQILRSSRLELVFRERVENKKKPFK